MSGVKTIDVAVGDFWIVVCLAALVLIPLTNGRLRSWVLAFVNLGMIAILVGSNVVWVAAAVVVAWTTLLFARRHATAAWLGGAAVTVLFLIHKVPHWSEPVGVGRINPILASVGISYVFLRFIEVARGVADQRHVVPTLAATINYLLPFHMLAAGPIQSYDDFVAQPAVPPPPTAGTTISGVERIAIGFFKKYVLAEIISVVFLTGFRAPWPYTLAECQFNYLWLYLDFSAYSDIAVGVGRLIGFATPENFNHPYIARNPIDYWERWHISLSQFIKRNVFMPLQLAMLRTTDGQAQMPITVAAFFISFSLCGLWHNVSYEMLAWGLYHAAGLSVCSMYKQVLLKRNGRKWVNRYLANPWIKAVAIFAMFEFAAFGVLIQTYPFREMFQWTTLQK
jgi:D-alanyl-lipoteichoic acid acyltransferase DltB (MBOAT superfamily)